MSEDPLNYPRMMLGIVRQALQEVAETGLPGEHFFYLSFLTQAPGVQIPAFLRDQYPREMTIVLQNQFWDLGADEQSFWVTLSFNAVRHQLIVPWSAVTAFSDPPARFGLRLEGVGDSAEIDETDNEPKEETKGTVASAKVVDFERFRKR